MKSLDDWSDKVRSDPAHLLHIQMFRTIRLATILFLSIFFVGMAGIVAVLLYQMYSVGAFNAGVAGYWVFIPEWRYLALASALAYTVCLGFAWLYMRLRTYRSSQDG